MAGTLSEQLAEKSRENHERIDKLAPEASDIQAPQPVSPDDALAGMKDRVQVGPKPIDKNDMSMYNYKTGQHLMEGASDKDIARIQAANRAADRLWQLYQENDNPSDSDIEAALGSDAFAFNRVYGDKKDNWATAFGHGYLGGNITSSQRAAADEYRRKRQEYEDQQAASKQDAARAAYEAQYVVKLGDTEIPITKDFSDNVKSIGEAYSRLMSSEEALDNPENKTKRQQVVGALREQLKAAGIDLGPAPEGGEFETIQDLVESAPDYQTENAIMQALQMAGDRKDYDPESQVDVLQMQQERDERKAAIDLRNKNREIERARNRQSIAGLAAMIGDMIRASEGARVDPRDWQQMYDNLSAQEKANVNNYQIRMQKIADDIKQQRMLEKQRADAKAAAQLKLDADAAEKEKDRRNRIQLQKMKAEASRINATIYAGSRQAGGGGSKSASNIRAFGNNNEIDASQYDATMRAVYGMLKNFGVNFGIGESITGAKATPEVINRTATALQNAEQNEDGTWTITTPVGTFELTDDEKKQIDDYLAYVASLRGGGSAAVQNNGSAAVQNNGGSSGGYNPDEKKQETPGGL